MRAIAILGSTGSIGTQALTVAARHADRFRIAALTAYGNAGMLFDQVRRFRPQVAGLVKEPDEMPEDVRFCDWVFGEKCLRAAATLPEADSVLVSVVGFAGLPAVLDALSCGKRVLLANKEALVAGGSLVMAAARGRDHSILPVDSEHSAIFQCLRASDGNAPEKLLLTASGGPFRTWTQEAMEWATAAQALQHPNWAMGPKITVDSATMMNKGLEVIEAHWLFDMPAERIDVLIHPESIVHSLVAFQDGALLAQMGTPDMRVPILYAMSFPERLETGGERLDLSKAQSLSFGPPDLARFPCLRLAYEALAAGGTAPAMLNAANEAAVEAFLAGRIAFGRIYGVVSEVLQRMETRHIGSLGDVLEADAAARRMAARFMT